VLFVTSYWYLFFIDKTTWNNHSYLFGLVGVMLLLTDTNRYWYGFVTMHEVMLLDSSSLYLDN